MVAGFALGKDGLDVLVEILTAVSPQTDIAHVVLHRGSEPKSEAAQRLSACGLPIEVVERSLELKRGRVYLVCNGYGAALSGDLLELSPPSEVDATSTVDTFFESLVQSRGCRAMAVLLGSHESGDGVAGLKAVTEQGLGLLEHESICVSATISPELLRSGCLSLSPLEMADRLEQHASLADQADPFLGKDSELAAVFGILHNRTAVNFESYKRSTVRRRLLKRMVSRNTPDLKDYITLLRKDPAELPALYAELLVGVTELFRDPEVFSELSQTILPAIIGDGHNPRPLRVWVPGCSKGDEVYSIAISFLEAFRHKGARRSLQIFATDLNETALCRARVGRYLEATVEKLPKDIQSYFVKSSDGYQISRSVRELCIFARQDVTQDPPFSHLDLVSCRNLLIYLSPTLQKRALQHFHYALRPGGFLVLGSSESLGDCESLFTDQSKKHKIFQKKAVATPDLTFVRSNQRLAPLVFQDTDLSIPPAYEDHDVSKHADRLILARYCPPGVIIDENLDILQFRGRTGAYLEPPVGAASLNILKMAREGLLAALKMSIEECLATETAVKREDVQLRDGNGGVRRLNLDIVPIRMAANSSRYLLVLFNELVDSSHRTVSSDSESLDRVSGPSQEAEILYLRHELLATREYLSSIIQDRESSNEELKAANEEAQSANEELQSANEELETAKEELQSTNEELATINEEVHDRNAELHRANSDLNNILSSVETPVVILDCDFAIRRFTPSAQFLLNLLPGDLGRPFHQVRSQIEVPNLDLLARTVLETLVSQEVEQQGANGHWYSLQVRPYRTVDNRIDGVVISYLDITDLKANRIALENAERAANRLLEIYPHPLSLLNSELTLVAANSRFQTNFPALEGKHALPKLAHLEGPLVSGKTSGLPGLDELDGLGEELRPIVEAYTRSEKSGTEKLSLHFPGRSQHPVYLRKIKLHESWYVMLEIQVDG